MEIRMIRFSSSQAMIMDGVKDFFEPQPRPTGHGPMAPPRYPLTTQKQALGKEGNDKLLGNFRFHFEALNACRFDMELL